jgi:peptidoglycan/xylan/chitin deacetylase (PgdA/CDA1 family)
MNARGIIRGGAERVLAAAPRRTAPGDRLILAYHNVVPAGSSPVGDRSLHLPVDHFEDQLRVITTEADVVPLMDLLETEQPTARRVAITFDDAYATALTLGVGACVARRLPCTVFVAPSLLGLVPAWDVLAEAGRWSDAERERFLWENHGLGLPDASLGNSAGPSDACRIATVAQLRDTCRRPGVTVGNHTLQHANLGALDTEAAGAQLAAAASWLAAEAIGPTVPVVAYPYGIAPKAPAASLTAAALRFGLAVRGGWWRQGGAVDTTAVPRWNVPAGISTRGFAMRLRGWRTDD